MQLNLLVLSYVASGGVSVAVAAAAWRRRSVAGAHRLAFLMLAVAWWLLANAFEAAAIDRTAKIAWSVIAYPGIVSVPVFYLLFVLGWTRQDGWLTRWRIALLLVLPVVSVGMAATNEWHHLLWPSVTLIDAWGVTGVYAHGPWFWVEIGYAYLLVGAGLLALIVALYRYPAAYTTRMRLAIAASFMPVVANLAYVFGWADSLHADLSSIAFAITGLIVGWAILRAGLLDLTPVAWATLVETLVDAVLVLDPDRRVAAYNPAAGRLLALGKEAIGQPLGRVLDRFPELATVCQETGDLEMEIQVGPAPSAGESGDRWFDVRVSAIADKRGRDLGCLVVLRDVTERRLAVENVRKLSLTDELTGLLNRRGFVNLAEHQLLTATRTRNRLWLLFADLDDLKTINDRLGHAAGDRALCEIARVLRTTPFREADLVARLGGDEFAVLATEISRTEGSALADRFKAALARANEAPGRELALSVSVGVALFDPDRPLSLDDLIHEADRRMYQAKHARQAGAGRMEGARPDDGEDGAEAAAGAVAAAGAEAVIEAGVPSPPSIAD